MPMTAGCAQAAMSPPQPITITIAGATSMHPVLQELTDEFHRLHPNVHFSLRGGGSALAEEQLRGERIDLAATTLFQPDMGAGILLSAGQAPRFMRTPIGIDGLAVIVHTSNSVTSLTAAELKALFSARIFDWEEVGGNKGEVVLISREDGSGARHLFEERVMGERPVSLTAVVMPTSRDVVEYTAKHPSAVGYVSRAYVIDNLADQSVAPDGDTLSSVGSSEVKNPKPIRVVPLDGFLPTHENLKTGMYPLVQPLYLVSRGEPQGWVHQFVDFVLDPAGQSIVARHHLPVR